MKKIPTFIVTTILALLLIGEAAAGTIIVNTGNDTTDAKSISAALVGKQKFWGSGKEVVIAMLQGDSDAESALKEATGMDASRFKNHWQRLAFSGRGKMPKHFTDIGALLAFVQTNQGAIGIAPDSIDLSSVKKVN